MLRQGAVRQRSAQDELVRVSVQGRHINYGGKWGLESESLLHAGVHVILLFPGHRTVTGSGLRDPRPWPHRESFAVW